MHIVSNIFLSRYDWSDRPTKENINKSYNLSHLLYITLDNLHVNIDTYIRIVDKWLFLFWLN